MKVAKISLIILICLACLVGLYLGFVFLFGSGFIFAGDIDLTDAQRKTADTKATTGSVFGLILMLISSFIMLLSSVISDRILKLFGGKIDE